MTSPADSTTSSSTTTPPPSSSNSAAPHSSHAVLTSFGMASVSPSAVALSNNPVAAATAQSFNGVLAQSAPAQPQQQASNGGAAAPPAQPTPRKPHVCPQCQKCFSSTHQLAQHSRVHTGEKPYSCSYCQRKFKQLSHVQQHTRLHTGERPYKCTQPECGRSFIQLSNLQQHMKTHSAFNKSDRDREKRFFCSFCNKGFKAHSSLVSHEAKHKDPNFKYKMNTRKTETQNAQPNTTVSADFGRTEQSLQQTQRPIPLAMVGGTGQGTTAQRLPVSIVQNGIWPCTVCGSVFTSEYGLLGHLDETRNDPKHQLVQLSNKMISPGQRQNLASISNLIAEYNQQQLQQHPMNSTSSSMAGTPDADTGSTPDSEPDMGLMGAASNPVSRLIGTGNA